MVQICDINNLNNKALSVTNETVFEGLLSQVQKKDSKMTAIMGTNVLNVTNTISKG